MIKKILSLLVALTMTLATCATAMAATEEQMAELTKDPVELSMIWWGSQTRIDNTTAANDVFMEKYPNVKINWEAVSWADYWTTLSTRAAAGSLPDIIQQDYAYINAYYNDNTKLLVNLNPYVESGVLDLTDCGEASYAPGVINGDLIAVNLGMNSECVMIDKEIFEKAGIAIPENTWTRDDYKSICEQLVAKKDELGIDYAAGSGKTTLMNNFFRENGLFMYNQDGSNAFGWEKEEGKEIMRQYVDWYKELVSSGDEIPLAVRQENEIAGPESCLIVTGKAAIQVGNWSNQCKAISNAAGKTFAIVALPDKAEKKMQYIKASQFFSVSSSSKYPELAAAYISAVTNDIDMNYCLNAERGVPIASKVRDALAAKFEEGSIDKAIFDYLDQIIPIANTIQQPEPAVQSEVGTAMWNMMTQVIDQGVDFDTAFEEFYSNCDFAFSMAA